MAGKRVVLLQVDEERADELIDALAKRSFVKIISLDRETRKALGSCPVCERKFGKELLVTVNEELFWMIDGIISRMLQSGAKSVVVVPDEKSASDLVEVEKRRAVICSPDAMARATRLGLLAEIQDGRYKTHYPTQACLDFFSNSAPLAPSKIVIADGKVIERHGTMTVEHVKFKDQIIRDRMLRDIKRKIDGLSERVKIFVRTGQMPLI